MVYILYRLYLYTSQRTVSPLDFQGLPLLPNDGALLSLLATKKAPHFSPPVSIHRNPTFSRSPPRTWSAPAKPALRGAEVRELEPETEMALIDTDLTVEALLSRRRSGPGSPWRLSSYSYIA